jgi:hypothetical protein
LEGILLSLLGCGLGGPQPLADPPPPAGIAVYPGAPGRAGWVERGAERLTGRDAFHAVCPETTSAAASCARWALVLLAGRPDLAPWTGAPGQRDPNGKAALPGWYDGRLAFYAWDGDVLQLWEVEPTGATLAVGPATARPPDLATLKVALGAPDPMARQGAVRTLAASPDPGRVALLQQAAHDPSPDVRAAAVAALGRLPDHAAIDAVSTSLSTDPVAEVRVTAADALAEAALPSTRAVLERAVAEDPDPRVRGAASAAIGHLPPEPPPVAQ